MKYMITNGNEYINILQKNPAVYVTTSEGFSLATKLKYSEAQNFINQVINKQRTRWSVQKIKSSSSKKNYIISTGKLYIGNGGEYTSGYHAAKWFKSVADADTYIRTHNMFPNAIIVDEEGVIADAGEKRTFSDEQLETLGIKKTTVVSSPTVNLCAIPPDDSNLPCNNKQNIEKRIQIKAETKRQVYKNSNGICGICGRPITNYGSSTVDHIIPLARGGKNEMSNYRITCAECNTIKGSLKDDEMAKSLTTILSNQLQQHPNRELENILVRSIVRGRIGTMTDRISLFKKGEHYGK